MARISGFLSAVLLFGLASCSGDAPPSDNEDASTLADNSVAGLVDGSLGQVSYRYDPTILTRAEIELPLPPDFSETAFAVKFLPSSMTGNIGFGGCSYGTALDASSCTADREVGLALALLERPLSHYRDRLEKSALASSLSNDASLGDVRGFVVSRHSDNTTTHLRYVFVPLGDRTLLAVERTEDGIVEGEQALAAVRASISF